MVRTFVIFVMVSASLSAAAQQPAPPPSPALSPADNMGRKVFQTRCAMCHVGQEPATELASDAGGRRGGGARTMGPLLSKINAANEERLRDKIKNGGPRMPGYKLALTEEQITQLIGFLRTVERPLTSLAAARPGE
jgi:mono/diheme cytochrome c family protein